MGRVDQFESHRKSLYFAMQKLNGTRFYEGAYRQKEYREDKKSIATKTASRHFEILEAIFVETAHYPLLAVF